MCFFLFLLFLLFLYAFDSGNLLSNGFFSLGSAESVLSAVNMCVLQSLFTRLIVWTGVAEMFKRHEYPYKCLFSFEICRDNLLAHLVVLRLTASIGYPRVGVFNVCFVRFRFYRMRALCRITSWRRFNFSFIFFFS